MSQFGITSLFVGKNTSSWWWLISVCTICLETGFSKSIPGPFLICSRVKMSEMILF